ncbi:MAG: hypothetical protein HKP40_05455 [Litoreibacter sp.]|nr:hypothetical protein [Litoreibacter sp.]
MSYRLEKPLRCGGTVVAAISRTRVINASRARGVFVAADKRPVIVAVLCDGVFSAQDLSGADVSLRRVEELCPGTLDQMQKIEPSSH